MLACLYRNAHLTLESNRSASVEDQPSSADFECHDRKPVKRPHADEGASSDNSDDDIVTKTLLLPMELHDLILEQLGSLKISSVTTMTLCGLVPIPARDDVVRPDLIFFAMF